MVHTEGVLADSQGALETIDGVPIPSQATVEFPETCQRKGQVRVLGSKCPLLYLERP
jgi:hypothetical protein